ncbi:MAG: ATP-dependent helicase, partial [Chloroflexales bacterium]|nr:ATP-dependent helicase [Chloroflexales bacterium]
MAELLPPEPIGSASPETARVLQRLKRLPDGYLVRQWLDPTRPGPAFWLADAQGRSALIAVASARPADARRAIQQDLFGQGERIGTAEVAVCAAFHDGLGISKLPVLLLVPNVLMADVQPALASLPTAFVVGAKEQCAPDSFTPWIVAQLGPPLPPAHDEALRRAFCPEVIVPAALTVRSPEARATSAALSDYLLSYDQEWLLKHDLALSDEAAALEGDLSLTLINGVAGSGKSLVLLYRARLLRQFFPHKRILVLTHNRPLILDLRRRYHALSDGDQGIEWRTFHSWCQAHWPAHEPRLALIGSSERRALVRAIWQTNLADLTLAPESLLDEIDWLKDRLITTREGYREADRSGRGFGLSTALRDRVYGAMLAYQTAVQARGLADYGDVPRRIWRALQEDRTQFPTYDFVLIDEAQFFAPIWFAIIKELLRAERGRLFLVADPTQGFLKRRQSWLTSGLAVRGRSHRLVTCYRTSGPILAFAQRWYQQRLPDDSEALVGMPAPANVIGPAPQLIVVQSEQDELTRVVNEIRALVERGTALNQILVLHSEWQGAA